MRNSASIIAVEVAADREEDLADGSVPPTWGWKGAISTEPLVPVTCSVTPPQVGPLSGTLHEQSIVASSPLA